MNSNLLKEAQDLLKSCDEEEAKAAELRAELKAMSRRLTKIEKRLQATRKEVAV